MRGGSHVILILGAIVAGLALLVFAGPKEPVAVEGPAELVAASGSLQIENSRGGRAILRGVNLAPGQSVGGWLRIRNASPRPAVLWLRIAPRSATTSGLARRLRLRVSRVKGPACSHALYAGHLDRARTLRFGRMGRGKARTYRFRVRLPSGTGNGVQGEITSVKFRWLLREDDEQRPLYPCFHPGRPSAPETIATG